jgi:hypothetical protein
MGNNPSVRQFKKDMTDFVNETKYNFHERLLLQADELVGNIKNAIHHSVTGDLKASVRKKDVSQITAGGLSSVLSVLVIAGGTPTTRRSGKTGEVYDYAVATEFGTVKESPLPFFYGTARFYQQHGFDGFQETLADTIAENNKIRSLRSNPDQALRASDYDLRTQSTRGAVVIKGKI